MRDRNKQLSLFALAALTLISSASLAQTKSEAIDVLKETGKAFTHVARSAIPAVVYIEVEQIIEARGPQGHYNDPFGFFGDDMLRRFFGVPEMQPRRRFRREGAGSGFIISEDGYILTNSHVVGDASKIRVRLHDGTEYEAEQIGSDEKSEVAIIKIDADDLPTIPLGNSDELEVGEWVIAVGNPFGLTETVTAGIVSALGRRNIGIADYEDFIQTDAAINPGNSGGPLLNINGEVIGINTAIYSRSGGYMGVGFAIPINMAKSIKEQLIESGEVSRGYLGIYMQDLTSILAESLGLAGTEGVIVSDVVEKSPAAKAGLQQGDIIIKIDDTDVKDSGSLRNEVSSRPPKTKIALTILRDGKVMVLEAVTGSLKDSQQLTEVSNDDLFETVGMRVDNISSDYADRFGYRLDEGVIITEVEPGGKAARVGLRPGALITGVNLKKTGNLEQFMDAFEEAKRDERLVLRVRTGRFHQYVAIELK